MSFARAIAIIWGELTPGLRRRFVMLQFVAALMAISTVVGLAAVMTFLAVLADPTLIGTHASLAWLWRALDATSTREFLVTLGGGFIAVLCLSTIVNICGSFAMGRFAHSVGDRMREVLFARYLRRDYLFHARVGAAPLMDNVLHQAYRVTTALLNAQVLMTNAVLTVFVVASIAVVNLAVALGGVLAVAGSYLVFYQTIRRRVGRNGRVQTELGAEQLAVVEQSFLGIKYLMIARAQTFFSRRFSKVTHALSDTLAENQFISQFPRFVLECAAGAALIACAAFVSGGTPGTAWLAQLSFIGFAGLRLLPAFQQMYNAMVVVRANRHAITSLASELVWENRLSAAPESSRVTARMALARSIELSDVSFRYSPEAPLVLAGVSLRVAAGTATGIVGASGSGKTTLVDLILGLLLPSGGRIEVDGETLDEHRMSGWQQTIGYVPQDVVVLDASVRENIAFGIDADKIDDARVREVAREAGASEFIEAMPGGYSTRISGVAGCISGGQRQRLGIARALYGNPSLLVLDEATNSLDAATELAVIDTVVRNRGTRTLIIVAHGAALIDACDHVYELRGGALLDRSPPSATDRVHYREMRG